VLLDARSVVSAVGLAVHSIARVARPGPSLRILYYHSISDDPIRSTVSPGDFERQIEYLARSPYRVVSLADVVRRLVSGAPVPDSAVAITLDDGFRDNYDRALPVLARFGLTATVFLTVSYIGTDRLPTLTRTNFVPRPLDWAQVKEMHASGIEFGSHTLTHPMLSALPLDQVRRELGESKRRIEDELGAPAPLFCYPRGDFSPAVKTVVREQGYVGACTTRPGMNDAGTDVFALRRTYIGRRDTLPEFARKLAGAYDALQQGLRVWKAVRAKLATR
jgi:peptidoglycan/xylan/chitin deacetylase (PgdA/CDA1 family)